MLPMCLQKKKCCKLIKYYINEDCTHAWAQLCQAVCQSVISHTLGMEAPFKNPCIESDRVNSRLFRANTFDQLTSLAKVLDLGLDCGPKSPPKPRHGLMELGPSSLIMKKFF